MKGTFLGIRSCVLGIDYGLEQATWPLGLSFLYISTWDWIVWSCLPAQILKQYFLFSHLIFRVFQSFLLVSLINSIFYFSLWRFGASLGFSFSSLLKARLLHCESTRDTAFLNPGLFPVCNHLCSQLRVKVTWWRRSHVMIQVHCLGPLGLLV